jgi:N-acetylglucosaminyl-diphospho-decaprenol L-rhamnosyltransferase
MNHNIKVSIITVTFNCEAVIEQNIKFCMGIPDCEHIIIDNNSSDSTPSTLGKYEENIVLIQNKQNLGFTKANNQGINIAKGEYIFLLNPDAYLIGDTVKILSQYLDNHLDVGAVAPVLEFPNGDIQNYTRRLPKPLPLFIESFVPNRYWNQFNVYRDYTCQSMDFLRDNIVEQPAGAGIMFRNEFQLDETYFIYVSDVELCKNILDKGYKIIQVSSAKIGHYMSKGGTENVNPQLRLFLDLDNYYGMQYFFRKHKQTMQLLMYRVLFFFGLLITAIVSSFNAKRTIKWKRFIIF